MPDLTIPPGDSFTVLNQWAVEYGGVKYMVDGSLTMTDGTLKTLGELIVANGGAAYSENELKRCFKIEGIDPDANGASWFSVYSSNSKQTGKNESAKVPGGMWAEWLDFAGEPRADGGYDNPVLQLWQAFGKGPADWSSSWIGFRLAYGTAESRAYVITYRDDFLQESVPSPPVNIDCTFMHDVQLQGIYQQTPTDPGGHPYVPIKNIRLWRSVIGTDGSTVYRLVPAEAVSNGYNSAGVVLEFNHDPGKFTQQIPDPAQSYGYQIRDSVTENELLSETLQSTDWDPPPFREAQQLVGMWNGMMAVHVGNTVMFCEPYRPHAWPVKYRYALPFEVISKQTDGDTLVVTTTGPAFLFTGTHPGQMTYAPVVNTQAGKPNEFFRGDVRTPGRAICRTPIGVCYATDDGIVASNMGRSTLLTDKLFTKDEWKNRYGTKFGRMRLAYSNGKLLCWFWRTAEVGFIMDLAGTSLTEWSANPYVGVASQMPGSEGLYVVGTTGGTTSTLQRFEDPATNRMQAEWLSKKVILPYPHNFGCFQIVGSGQVTIKVYGGSVEALNITLGLIDGVPQVWRLPHGYREREWTVRFILQSNAIVREFYLATHPEELRGA